MPASSPRLVVEHLGLPALAFAVAQVHAQQHVRPVLALRAAGAGVDRDDRVRTVVLAAQHAGELGPSEGVLNGREHLLELAGDRLFALFFAKLDERLDVLQLRCRSP